MKTLRIFHPIGQGAFYSEVHENDNTKFTIVYDCGSSTFKGKKMETLVSSTFPENYEIDILFISHFHTDHVNGIEFLKKKFKIKKVILPLLDDEAKSLLKISNFINFGDTNTQLIDNPIGYFDNQTSLVFIDEVNLDEDTDGINIENVNDIPSLTSGATIKSGSVLTTGIVDHDWLFIPFNYKQHARRSEFITELSNLGLTISDIDTIEKISTHKVNIRKAYDKIQGDLNENSLLLFSGKEKAEYVNYFHNHSYFHFLMDYPQAYISCIYFGDINLREPGIINDIKRKLRKVWNTVGTIQVPHHGAINNFDKAIFNSTNISCAVVSFGKTNTYGHPSATVVGQLLTLNILPYSVTEDVDSRLVQWK